MVYGPACFSNVATHGALSKMLLKDLVPPTREKHSFKIESIKYLEGLCTEYSLEFPPKIEDINIHAIKQTYKKLIEAIEYNEKLLINIVRYYILIYKTITNGKVSYGESFSFDIFFVYKNLGFFKQALVVVNNCDYLLDFISLQRELKDQYGEVEKFI